MTFTQIQSCFLALKYTIYFTKSQFDTFVIYSIKFLFLFTVVRKRKLGGNGGAFSRGAYTKKRRKKSKQLKIQAKSPSSLQNSPQHVPKSPKGFTFQRQDSATSLDEDNAARSNDENAKSEDESILGKGKRKRFQNVRMLPIEEVCKSPPRKKSPSN